MQLSMLLQMNLKSIIQKLIDRAVERDVAAGSATTAAELRIKYKKEYEDLIKIGGIKSLPIEYYNILWSSFARDENITIRTIPIKSALIDSASNKFQNGSDVYISRIIKEFLE